MKFYLAFTTSIAFATISARPLIKEHLKSYPLFNYYQDLESHPCLMNGKVPDPIQLPLHLVLLQIPLIYPILHLHLSSRYYGLLSVAWTLFLYGQKKLEICCLQLMQTYLGDYDLWIFNQQRAY